MQLLLIICQYFCTIAMTGIIWFVQIVHYPLFIYISDKDFQQFESSHTQKTGWIVAPIMLCELGTSILVFFFNPTGSTSWEYLVAFILLIIIWLSTFLIQVPIHSALLKEREESKILKLVKTNWIRTIAWTLRAILLSLYILHLYYPS